MTTSTTQRGVAPDVAHDVAECNQLHQAIKEAPLQSLLKARTIGAKLQAARSVVKYGKWEDRFQRAGYKFSFKTAETYLRIAEQWTELCEPGNLDKPFVNSIRKAIDLLDEIAGKKKQRPRPQEAEEAIKHFRALAGIHPDDLSSEERASGSKAAAAIIRWVKRIAKDSRFVGYEYHGDDYEEDEEDDGDCLPATEPLGEKTFTADQAAGQFPMAAPRFKKLLELIKEPAASRNAMTETRLTAIKALYTEKKAEFDKEFEKAGL